MPLWQIYHPEPAFSTADKRALAQKVTALYRDFLPRFYVNVFFHALPRVRPISAANRPMISCG